MSRFTRRLALAAWGLSSLSATGCTAFLKAIGARTDLKDKPVDELHGSLGNGVRALCPGTQAPLILSAKLKTGEILVTEGAGNGKVTWDSFTIQGQGAAVDGDGIVTVDRDPRSTAGKPAQLAIAVVGQSASTSLAIPTRYDCVFGANFDGPSGRSGADGAMGHRGQDGQDSSASGDSATPGGNGSNGGPGQNGGNGEAALKADDIEVQVGLLANSDRPLLQVRVHSLNHDQEAFFLVDPQGGALKVTARGGNGGRGGTGGAGGGGGRGGYGAPPGNGGIGGDGGDGGDGADGADGGRISVTISPAAKPYLASLSFDNRGGAGGSPGEPGGSGFGGSATGSGNTGSMGHQGRAGNRQGRDGRAGPKVEIKTGRVAPLF